LKPVPEERTRIVSPMGTWWEDSECMVYSEHSPMTCIGGRGGGGGCDGAKDGMGAKDAMGWDDTY
jgi:hypothetical protein